MQMTEIINKFNGHPEENLTRIIAQISNSIMHKETNRDNIHSYINIAIYKQIPQFSISHTSYYLHFLPS